MHPAKYCYLLKKNEPREKKQLANSCSALLGCGCSKLASDSSKIVSAVTTLQRMCIKTKVLLKTAYREQIVNVTPNWERLAMNLLKRCVLQIKL